MKTGIPACGARGSSGFRIIRQRKWDCPALAGSTFGDYDPIVQVPL
jgi:hypothetical protein